jgi:hypothetical protein
MVGADVGTEEETAAPTPPTLPDGHVEATFGRLRCVMVPISNFPQHPGFWFATHVHNILATTAAENPSRPQFPTQVTPTCVLEARARGRASGRKRSFSGQTAGFEECGQSS